MTVRILIGDCRAKLREIDAGSVNCCVTSPPYFWQRDYGVPEQIGHEPTIDGYVQALVDVFDEVKRVLADDGLLFLNLGDTFYSAKGQPHGRDTKSAGREFSRRVLRAVDGPGLGLPRKSLIGLPWRVALGLQASGWVLRKDIVWHRPTSLGEPTGRDRPAKTFEHVFMFAKSARYWFDRAGLAGQEDVWTIPARPDNPHRHVAPFPEELVQRCLDCGCAAGGTVLDPFLGSGTTAIVARRSGRSAIGIELNPAFAEQARARIDADAPLLGAA